MATTINDLLTAGALAKLDTLGDIIEITRTEVVTYTRTLTRADLNKMIEQAGPEWIIDPDDLSSTFGAVLNGVDGWEWFTKHNDIREAETAFTVGDASEVDSWL